MIRFKSFFFLAILMALLLWNVRLHHENRRLAGLLREARRSADKSPAAPAHATDPALAARIQDERDTIDALSQQLRASGFVDVSGLKRAVSNQEQLVDDLHQEMKRLIASRPAALDTKAQRQQLTEQIDAEMRLIAQLKSKTQRLRASKKKELREEIPTLIAQTEAEQQVVKDLKAQRSTLKDSRQPAAAPSETPEQAHERQELETRITNETARLSELRKQLEVAGQTPVDEEGRRVQQELEKHQAVLRDLEARAK